MIITGGGRSPDPVYDLAGGDSPPPESSKTLDEIIEESKSRRGHRKAAAILVYIVVLGLIAAVLRMVFKVAHDIEHINPSAVAMVASLVIAISVLTIALSKFSFGLGQDATKEAKNSKDTVTTPSVEAFKIAGDLLGKISDAFKGMKP